MHTPETTIITPDNNNNNYYHNKNMRKTQQNTSIESEKGRSADLSCLPRVKVAEVLYLVLFLVLLLLL